MTNNADNANNEVKSFEELMEAADSGKMTEDEMQDELAKYKRAIEQEYESQIPHAEAEDNVEAVTRGFFKKCTPSAATTIFHLSQFADSESVKFSASKYIIEAGRDESEKDGDPIKEFLNSLGKDKKNKNKKTAATPDN